MYLERTESAQVDKKLAFATLATATSNLPIVALMVSCASHIQI